ncbi:ABC transporter permease [Alicyclobacillus fodiniaquatilis]|uniref:ABC transporter permease n=1 Tax=Alicyclobacillus fodiniaquatilis TaxID=1661150 RepID=A0ABW4JFG1_9BACL
MGLLKFLGKRIVALIVTISLVLIVAYLLMYYSPGSFFNSTNIAAGMGQLRIQDPALYQQFVKEFQSRYGLDQPLWQQVLKYVWHSLTFNFGNSFQNPSVPISSQLSKALPISALLAVGSVLLSIIVGIPLGVLAALKRNTWIDSTLTTLSMTGQAIPSYVLAVLLVLLFGVWVQGILPVNGWGTLGEAILPIIALSAANIGVVTRYMRGSLVEGLRQEYIRTAQAKGVRYWPLVIRHGMRNSLTALITVVGPTFAFTVVSTVWVEQIFSIPGIGNLLSTAFPAKDVPLSITSVYILCLMVMGMNLVVDLLYGLIDPRVQLE